MLATVTLQALLAQVQILLPWIFFSLLYKELQSIFKKTNYLFRPMINICVCHVELNTVTSDCTPKLFCYVIFQACSHGVGHRSICQIYSKDRMFKTCIFFKSLIDEAQGSFDASLTSRANFFVIGMVEMWQW